MHCTFFAGLDLGKEPALNETTTLKFRHLLEAHDLGKKLFHLIDECLEANGLKVSQGTIVEATIVSAPSSIKNRDKKWESEMHSTKKGTR